MPMEAKLSPDADGSKAVTTHTYTVDLERVATRVKNTSGGASDTRHTSRQ